MARADQIQTREGAGDTHWFAPIVADAEAGFGGPLNAFELMKWMIDAGAAGVHFEDQPVAKRGSHGAAVVSIAEAIEKLVAARLAADVCAVPSLIIARTDAEAARFLTGRPDERDRPFLTGEDSNGGDLGYKGGLDAAIARACALRSVCRSCCGTKRRGRISKKPANSPTVFTANFPEKMLAYNCPPSFNWKRKLDEATIQKFQRELGAMGYKFQFVTLAGFHALNHSMFTLAKEYATDGMMAYAKLQEQEFQSAKAHRFPAIKHQRFVGNGYFDDVMNTVLRGLSPSTSTDPAEGE